MNLTTFSLLRLLVLLLLVPVVCGCGENPGEVPELNPDAHKTLTMDIYIHGGDIDGVEVSSAWEMETRGCAKVNFPAGNLNIGHASPDEEVKKVGDHYESKILLDRFTQVPCRWVLGGVGLNFMKAQQIDSDYAAGVNDLIGSRGQQITCFARRGGFVGFCNLPSRLNDAQKEMTGKYTVNLEIK